MGKGVHHWPLASRVLEWPQKSPRIIALKNYSSTSRKNDVKVSELATNGCGGGGTLFR